MPESPFLDQLHARFAAPAPAVTAFVSRAAGADVTGLRRVVRGYDNEVYRAELRGAEAVYVRIKRYGDDDSFGGEVWAMARARSQGVPVPEVLVVDVLQTGTETLPVMLVAAATGTALSELLPWLSGRRRRTAFARLGEVLAGLHAITLPGPWRPHGEDPDDVACWPDPAGLRRGFIAERSRERSELRAAGLSEDEVALALAVLEESPDPPPSGFVLCHGDPTPDHVFVDADLRVTALIDWGMWHGGSMIGELAYAAAIYPEADLAAILDGHGGVSPNDPDDRLAIARVVVSQRIGHIAHHVRLGDHEGAASNLAALRRALPTAAAHRDTR